MANITDKTKSRHVNKRCPYCNTYLPLKAMQCTSCKRKVREVDEHGVAKKPFNWFGYLVAILSCCAFAIYMYWLFFLKS